MALLGGSVGALLALHCEVGVALSHVVGRAGKGFPALALNGLAKVGQNPSGSSAGKVTIGALHDFIHLIDVILQGLTLWGVLVKSVEVLHVGT